MVQEQVQVKRMTLAEWQAEGRKLFGPNMMLWRFRCPSCGTALSPLDFEAYRDRGATENSVTNECIGRYLGAKGSRDPSRFKPCDYTLGSLIKLEHVVVEHPGGQTSLSFPFADPVLRIAVEAHAFKALVEGKKRSFCVPSTKVINAGDIVLIDNADNEPQRMVLDVTHVDHSGDWDILAQVPASVHIVHVSKLHVPEDMLEQKAAVQALEDRLADEAGGRPPDPEVPSGTLITT